MPPAAVDVKNAVKTPASLRLLLRKDRGRRFIDVRQQQADHQRGQHACGTEAADHTAMFCEDNPNNRIG